MKKIALVLLGLSVLTACGEDVKTTASEEQTAKEVSAKVDSAKAHSHDSIENAKAAAKDSTSALKQKSEQVYGEAKAKAEKMLADAA